MARARRLVSDSHEWSVTPRVAQVSGALSGSGEVWRVSRGQGMGAGTGMSLSFRRIRRRRWPAVERRIALLCRHRCHKAGLIQPARARACQLRESWVAPH